MPLLCIVIITVKKKYNRISPWLYTCFSPCPTAHPWSALCRSLQLRKVSTMKKNTDWKSLRILIFMDIKKAIKLAKKESQKDRRKLAKKLQQCIKLHVIWKIHFKNIKVQFIEVGRVLDSCADLSRR